MSKFPSSGSTSTFIQQLVADYPTPPGVATYPAFSLTDAFPIDPGTQNFTISLTTTGGAGPFNFYLAVQFSTNIVNPTFDRMRVDNFAAGLYNQQGYVIVFNGPAGRIYMKDLDIPIGARWSRFEVACDNVGPSFPSVKIEIVQNK